MNEKIYDRLRGKSYRMKRQVVRKNYEPYAELLAGRENGPEVEWWEEALEHKDYPIQDVVHSAYTAGVRDALKASN